MCIRDSLVPYISGSDEYKSKPAQHSVKELQGMGVSPDIIILRADGSVGSDIRRKISTFCNVKPECVIENLTMPSPVSYTHLDVYKRQQRVFQRGAVDAEQMGGGPAAGVPAQK